MQTGSLAGDAFFSFVSKIVFITCFLCPSANNFEIFAINEKIKFQKWIPVFLYKIWRTNKKKGYFSEDVIKKKIF